MPRHVFDSGKLWLAAVVTPLTDAALVAAMVDGNLIGEVQSVSFNGSFEKADLNAPAAQSMFSVDTAFYSADSTLSIQVGDYADALFTKILNVTSDNAFTAGFKTYKIGSQTKPQRFLLIFEGLDTAGKKFRIILPNAAAPGWQSEHSLGQFAMPQFEPKGYQVGTEHAVIIQTEN